MGFIAGTRTDIHWKPCTALPAMLLCACAGPQSALDPAGPAAGTIATTWWIMSGVAATAWVVVLLLVLMAMRRGRRLAANVAPRFILVGGAIVPTLLLAALLVHGTRTSDLVTGRGAEVGHVVQVTARQWQWHFAHLDANGRVVAETIDRLTLPRDTLVEFQVGSADVIHSFWIPRLGGKMDAIPGRANVVRLRADRAGRMRGQCAEFCGLGHARMGFEVEILEPAAFGDWLARAAVAPTGNAPP